MHNVEILSLVSNVGQAETLASYLSEAEVPNHQFWVEDHYSFARELGRRRWGLVILAIDTKRDHIPACILRYPDTPFLAIVPRRRQHLIDELLDYGVIDVSSFSNHRRLQHTIARALREAAANQQHNLMARTYREHETLLSSLLHNLDEPIAFVHQGAHSYANPAYLRALGLANDTEATATPLLDLIATRDRKRMNKLLRDLQNRKLLSAELQTRIRQSNGNVTQVKFQLEQKHYQGESVTQIRVKPCSPKLSNNAPGTNHGRQLTPFVNQPGASENDLVTPLTAWAEVASDSLRGAKLQIAVRSIDTATAVSGGEARRSSSTRFSLAPELQTTADSVQSVEKLIADLRRLDLLDGFDQWLLYNAASSLAKRLQKQENCYFYVNLFSKGKQLQTLADWLPQLIGKFQLPENRLNLIVDIDGLTDLKEQSMQIVNSLRAVGVGVGSVETIYGNDSNTHLELMRHSQERHNNIAGISSKTSASVNTVGMPVDFKLLEAYRLDTETLPSTARHNPKPNGLNGLVEPETSGRPTATATFNLQKPNADGVPDSRYHPLSDEIASKSNTDSDTYQDSAKESLDLTLAIVRPLAKPATIS